MESASRDLARKKRFKLISINEMISMYDALNENVIAPETRGRSIQAN